MIPVKKEAAAQDFRIFDDSGIEFSMLLSIHFTDSDSDDDDVDAAADDVDDDAEVPD